MRWLIQSASHDLRHYLATIVANAEFLYEHERFKSNREEIFAEIQTASEQITSLLDSLQELAREGMDTAPAPAALDQMLRKAIASVRARPGLRAASISLSAAGCMSGSFDSRKLERAFLNLLLNACEATAPPAGRVEIDARAIANSFEVRVADNGPGIPPSIRNTLFEPFVSAGKPEGTGMGLAIVTKIVTDHGGSVTVERTSSAGTTFLVRLPRAVAAPYADDLLVPARGEVRQPSRRGLSSAAVRPLQNASEPAIARKGLAKRMAGSAAGV